MKKIKRELHYMIKKLNFDFEGRRRKKKPSIKLKTRYHEEHVEIRTYTRGNTEVFDKSNREASLEKCIMAWVRVFSLTP